MPGKMKKPPKGPAKHRVEGGTLKTSVSKKKPPTTVQKPGDDPFDQLGMINKQGTDQKPRIMTADGPRKKGAKQPTVQAYPIFTTMVYSRDWASEKPTMFDWEEMNHDLKVAILREQVKHPEGMYKSNAAGTWHSDTGLLKWANIENNAGDKLRAMWADLIKVYCQSMGAKTDGELKMHLSAWAMVYKDRGYATSHTHPNCHFAGVYYVDSGPASDPLIMATGAKITSGELEFLDTRGNQGHQVMGLQMIPAFRVPAQTGLMLVFPQWLPHFVHPVVMDNETEKPRVSISCNAVVRYRTAQQVAEAKDK